MATGRPVIAPLARDFPELVGSGGIQVPFGDQQGLGRAMADVLGDKNRHRQLAANARRRALERSWGASASRFGELLSEL
jgi:glycosyltransferase involved in cell wall biosynthesis